MTSFVTKERHEEIKLKYPLIEGKVCVNILITPDPNTPEWITNLLKEVKLEEKQK
jgi:hypothetical protein